MRSVEEPRKQLTQAQRRLFARRRAETHLELIERKCAFLRATCRRSDRLPAPLELESIRNTLVDLERLTKNS